MEKNEIKKIFKEYLPTKRMVESAKREAEAARKLAEGVRAVINTGMPHASGVSDPTHNAYCKIEAAEKKLRAAADRYLQTVERVEYLISLADDTYGQSVIRFRWIDGIGFDFIPAKINMDRRTMFRHYDRAIEEISEKSKIDTKWH